MSVEIELPHYVYRYYDADNALLYVGYTNNLSRRHRQHEKAAPWFNQAARHEYETYPDKESALEAERTQIRDLRPRENQQHNQPDRKKPTAWKPMNMEAVPNNQCGAMARVFNDPEMEWGLSISRETVVGIWIGAAFTEEAAA